MAKNNTDYSFMRTGRTLLNSPELIDDNERYIASLLTLFTSNSIVNASDYSELCGRNGITKEDMRYGLIYEVFEFLNNPNLIDDLKEIETQLEEDEYSEDEAEELFNKEQDVDVDVDNFERMCDSKINILEENDKEFVIKFHEYYDRWDTWVPNNDLEYILKSAIDKTKSI